MGGSSPIPIKLSNGAFFQRLSGVCHLLNDWVLHPYSAYSAGSRLWGRALPPSLPMEIIIPEREDSFSWEPSSWEPSTPMALANFRFGQEPPATPKTNDAPAAEMHEGLPWAGQRGWHKRHFVTFNVSPLYLSKRGCLLYVNFAFLIIPRCPKVSHYKIIPRWEKFCHVPLK
jgi:hypothetical protein